MAITTLDGYIGANKQIVKWARLSGRTTIAYQWFTVIDLDGSPGKGVLEGTSTTAGVVPTSSTAGFPHIYPYGTGKTGYLTRLMYSNGWGAVRLRLYDLLWKGGAYAATANVSLTGQPSFSARLPLDADSNPMYGGLEIWAECVTAFNNSVTFNVTYTNQDGTGSRTTGATGVGASPIVGRMWQLPLQSGDSGVRSIDGVVGAVATTGTANILVMRYLAEVRCHAAGYTECKGLDDVGFLQIPETAAIYPILSSDNTVSGVTDIYMEIASN